MNTGSLRLVLPDLVGPLAGAPDHLRRRAVTAAIDLVIARTGLAGPRVDRALAALAAGALEGAPCDDVAELADELDGVAFDLQDRLADGDDVEAGYHAAFAQARAAAAVAKAFDPDGLHAAHESLYEAYFALEDAEAIRITVLAALGE